MPSDQEVIAEVDAIAQRAAGLPVGTQYHRSRVGAIRRVWEKAREDYREKNGVDVLDAIKRHEAWLRSPENAPELYVERR